MVDVGQDDIMEEGNLPVLLLPKWLHVLLEVGHSLLEAVHSLLEVGHSLVEVELCEDEDPTGFATEELEDEDALIVEVTVLMVEEDALEEECEVEEAMEEECEVEEAMDDE